MADDADRETFSKQDIHFVLHVLRNPCGWSESNVRDARLKAADIIEWMAKRLEDGVIDGR